VTQVVQSLLCKHEALISNPVPPKKKKKEKKEEKKNPLTKLTQVSTELSPAQYKRI
jgi:hypothetical protein